MFSKNFELLLVSLSKLIKKKNRKVENQFPENFPLFVNFSKILTNV